MIKFNLDFNEYFNIPKNNIICYLLCLGILFAFYIVYIWPEIQELKQKNLEIELLNLNIKKQEKLYEFYKKNEEKNNNLNKYNILNLSKIEECGPQRLIFKINEKCYNNHIIIKNINPIIKFIDDNSEQLNFTIEMQGKLTDLYRVLKQIAMLSCVKQIEKIDIKKIAVEPARVTHKIILLLQADNKNQIKGN